MKICGENNENSVKYYESFETENEFAIVLELCDKSLTKYKNGRCFNSNEIYEIISQLNNTFKIMKKNKIVHRDLKPDNILIKNEKDKLIVKLCDYGISKNINRTKLRTHLGTVCYMAPEIMELKEGNIYDDKCDLWSLGIIIYELFFGYIPYNGNNEHIIIQQINKYGKKLLRKTEDKKLDDLINKLLEKDPMKRIGWDDYFNHPFFIVDEISIIYNTNKNKEIKIFGEEFVENNKNKCKIIYKGEYYELNEYFENKNDEDR